MTGARLRCSGRVDRVSLVDATLQGETERGGDAWPDLNAHEHVAIGRPFPGLSVKGVTWGGSLQVGSRNQPPEPVVNPVGGQSQA